MRTKNAVVALVFAVVVVCGSLKPANAGLFNINSGAIDGLLGNIDSNTAISSVDNTIQKLQAIEQTIVTTQQLVYQIESLKYMFANANNISSLVSDVANTGSMLAGMSELGLSSYSSLASAYNLPQGSPAEMADYMSNLAIGSSTLGALGTSAGELQNLGQQSGGMTGFGLLNGAGMITQAALTTTTAVANLQQYLSAKDQAKKTQAIAKKIADQQRLASTRMEYAHVPCLNRAATVTVVVAAQNSASGVQCTKVGAPRPIIVTDPVSSGINAQLRNTYMQQCAQAAQRQASALIAGNAAQTGQVTGQMGQACRSITPPVYAPVASQPVSTPTPVVPPPLPTLTTSTPFGE